MAILDLTQGLSDNKEYKAFKFPGGEIHFKLTRPDVLYIASKTIKIITRIQNSDELMILILAVDTIRKDGFKGKIWVEIPYFPYQQADRNFSLGESFSLKSITTILNSLDVDKYIVFDAHSDVTPALLKNCEAKDNSEFVKKVLKDIGTPVTLLSPDAGAYKKINKLADKIEFKGEIAAANKYRNISSGNIESLDLSKSDFKSADVLIIDDICMGGRTFIGLAEELKKRNVGKIYLAISHGIFNYGLKELEQHFEKIYTTTSRVSGAISEKLTVFDYE